MFGIVLFMYIFSVSFAEKDPGCIALCQADYDKWEEIDTNIFNSKGYYCGYSETNCWARETVPAGQADPCWSLCYVSPFDKNAFQACCYESAQINNDLSLDKCVAACPGDEPTPKPEPQPSDDVADTVEQTYDDNNEIFNSENPPPNIGEGTTSSLVEDIRLLVEQKAFGDEDAAKIRQVINAYSDDPKGDKNLITLLAVVGLLPDSANGFMTAIKPTDMMKSVTAQVLDEYAEEYTDVLGSLSDFAKEQLYRNLGKTLPKLIEYKYKKQQMMQEIYTQIKFNDGAFQKDDETFRGEE